MFINISVHYCHLHQKTSNINVQTLFFNICTYVTLNYQLIQNSLEFENLFFYTTDIKSDVFSGS
jgi:hypothetical protein